VQDWLNQCYEWIINEFHLNPSVDMNKIIKYVESQLLQSDLSASMVPGTGLPINVSELDNVKLRGPPILVEITSITEIGYSAIALQNIQQVRTDSHHLERLTNEDVDHDDENSMPDYPRSMLRFELSDGSTSFRAMEYQTLPELKLGTTPLGYKVSHSM
jgi:RecQ-mediated genome instability protein 1